ncbi:MAG: NAD(P)-dependent oxidoreductase [Bdellovibrionales bacterium]|jgi:nucleoside-diphosphate-sugar epimerase|nr:NAD(P)-dependent oxidoreductase [Bdellovibrionales bacterium]
MAIKKVFLTGASGFIGSNLSTRLQSVETQFAAQRSPHSERPYPERPDSECLRYEIASLQCDLLDYEKIVAELSAFQPDIIVHLAARTEVEKSFYEPASFTRVNFEGTVNLVEAARRACPKLELFLFSSTMETYGWQPASDMVLDGTLSSEALQAKIPVFDESTPQKPNAPYAVAKVACEHYLQYAERSYGLPVCILRQTNTYGRTGTDFFVVERIIQQMLTGKTCHLGYSKPWRNFLHIDDLLDCYESILSQTARARGQVFCTGPSNALSIEALAAQIADMLEWDGEIIWNTRPERVGEIYFLNSTAAHAKDRLGWEPKITLQEGLKRTIMEWRALRAESAEAHATL